MTKDWVSNDIEGARHFEIMNNAECEEEYTPDCEERDEEDDCNCSDMDCPCGGVKKFRR